MPPKKRVAATKLRWAKWREEPAEEEPDDEPEVELEEPEEDPAAADPVLAAYRAGEISYEAGMRKIEAEHRAIDLARDKEYAEQAAKDEEVERLRVAEADEVERLMWARLAEEKEVHRLRVQQQVAACANGCVCVCAYGGSRKRDFSAMGPP